MYILLVFSGLWGTGGGSSSSSESDSDASDKTESESDSDGGRSTISTLGFLRQQNQLRVLFHKILYSLQ